MSDSPRRLLLLRHAKAEGYADSDHARGLTDRGRRAATRMGLWLAARNLAPDVALVSSAARTLQTWEALAASARAGIEASVDDALYSAGPEAALEDLRSVPADARTVILVGHNPTVALLAHSLADGDPDPAAFRAMSEGYPTCALAVLEVSGEWADLRDGAARLTDFHVGGHA